MPSEPNYPVEDVPEVEPCDARAGALQWLGRVLRVAGIMSDDIAACRVRMLQGLAPERYGPTGYLQTDMVCEMRDEVRDVLNQAALWLAASELNGTGPAEMQRRQCQVQELCGLARAMLDVLDGMTVCHAG